MATLTLPALDLRSDVKSPYASAGGKPLLFKGRQLLVFKREVVLLEGTSVSRSLRYNDDVVSATCTVFQSSPETALVVCLRKAAHVYYPDGRAYVVSFPFVLRKAFPFESGLVLEKDQNQGPSAAFLAARLLTLTDPLGDFRAVGTSLTSVVAPHEELMCFPRRGLGKTAFLCATYSAHDRSLAIYHIRLAPRNAPGGPRRPAPRRKHLLMSTPNPSRILEDEEPAQTVLSVNMEKKRTSTLLSGASSMARMGLEPMEAVKPVDFALRKDMILTKMDTLHIKAKRSKISVFNVSFEDHEALVVANRAMAIVQTYIFQSLGTNPRYSSCYTVECLDAIPLNCDDHPGWLAVLKDDHTLVTVHPFLDIVSPAIDLSQSFPPLSRLLSSSGEDVAVQAVSFKSYTLKLILEPSNDAVRRCLQSLRYLSGSKVNQMMWVLWRSGLMLDEQKDDWNAFAAALLAVVFPFEKESHEGIAENAVTSLLPHAKRLNDVFSIGYSFSDLVSYIVLALHLVYEEMRLDSLNSEHALSLGTLLTQLTVWMGWPDLWTRYYAVEGRNIDRKVRFLLEYFLERPPNLLASLATMLGGNSARYFTFSQLVEESEAVDVLITPRTHQILRLFELLVAPQAGPGAVVDLMCEFGIKISDLETYPAGVYFPLKECISMCQENPAFEWNSSRLELVGRKDLSTLLGTGEHTPLYSSKSGDGTGRKDINAILGPILDKHDTVVAWDGQLEADRINVTKLIFDYDRRYYEITTLLHQTRMQTAFLAVEEGVSEYETVVLQRELAALVALRTLSLPLGRAPLFYAGRMPLLTEKFPIPKFNLSTVIAPKMATIVVREGTDALSKSITEWGHFHNGVSLGLSISRDLKGINGSWLIFNKPPSLNAQHAGFLLGLGLNGHLKRLEEWHIYNYLGPKHPLTSVALLVGMAASLRGSMDTKLTKVVLVHAVALLPQGANDLNVPVVVQTAGLVGIGLLYLETQHRRMSEILLSQVGGVFADDSDIHEGYRLAAGLALGLVNLGKGDDLRGLNDAHVVDRLLALAVLMRDYQPAQDLDKATSGAVLALGFIYMRTGNVLVAAKLRVPSAEPLLDYVRPDLLLLRCLARNLVLWDQIRPTQTWVDTEIPALLRQRWSSRLLVLDSDQAPYFNLLGGACLLIALKYASTGNTEARDTVLHYLDRMISVTRSPETNYDQKMAFHSAVGTQSLLALCLAVIMAGTGDLETLRRLRVLHSDTRKDMGYGNYMAVNMALGFLFLGGGQYAFSDSNFAVACLVVLLYPVFPGEGAEEVHLQALRHFWALAVEPRCLVIRDVHTRKPLKVPVTITYRSGRVVEALSPCLLPLLSEIGSVSTRSGEHFPVEIDFDLNSEYLEVFKRLLTIYVYRRRNHELLQMSVRALLQNENRQLQASNGELHVDSDIARLLSLLVMKGVAPFEKLVFLHESSARDDDYDPAAVGLGLLVFNIIDNKIELQRMAEKPKNVQDLWSLRVVFAYADRVLQNGTHYVGAAFVEQLKQQVWQLAGGK